jgi:hypothetical protein
MKYVIGVCLLTVQMLASMIALDTVVRDQQLVPVITVNGKIVIEVRSVGTQQVYASTFERSEKILKTMRALEEEEYALNRIRIRLGTNKSDYVAYVNAIEVYRVTPSDIVGTDMTTYQLAVQWRTNIYEALRLPSVATVVDGDDSVADYGVVHSPLVGLFSLVSRPSFFTGILQVCFFLSLQIGGMVVTFRYLNRRHQAVLDEFQERLKRFHHTQTQHQNRMASLEQQVTHITKTLNLYRLSSPDNENPTA